MPNMPNMPIDMIMESLLSALQGATSVVLQAPTGAGKTTRVPLAMAAAGWAQEGQIVVLEPRRVAARAAARRMASTWGKELGQEVGYQVRFDRKAGPATKILVVTEGIFLRMLQDDPFLEAVSVVIFDEFHERNLQTDVALAMVRKVQTELRDDLRMLVMSATLQTDAVAAYLDGCPVIVSEGRTYPVEIEYLPHHDDRPIHELAASGVKRMARDVEKDILVFLPGVGEIQRTQEALEEREWAQREGIVIHTLYGDLTPAQQDAVLLPGSQRKVILSTNLAETSLTIEGVEGVVDMGWVKVMRFDPGRELNALVLERSSQASAEQRAGRAGRLGPGRCLRMWTLASHQQRPTQDAPEITRVDITSTVLELLAWGETDLAAFPWLEAPSEQALSQALALLEQLGAIDTEHRITPLGRVMATFPLHPRLARLLCEGVLLRCLEEAAWLAAMINERDPFVRAARPGEGPPLDLLTRLHIVQSSRGAHKSQGWGAVKLKKGVVRQLEQGQRQLVGIAKDAYEKLQAWKSIPPALQNKPEEERLVRALLSAFPDRLARRRESADPHERRGVMVGHRGVRLPKSAPPFQTPFFLCIEIDAGKGGAESLLRQYVEVAQEWLPEEGLREVVEVVFLEDKERVMALQRVRWMDLLLQEAVASSPDPEQVASMLAEAASTRIEQALSLERPGLLSWLTRLRCLVVWMPELGLPTFGPDELAEMLPYWCVGKRSFDELRRMPLLELLKGQLTYEQLQLIEQHAPEKLEVPSGSWIKLQYEEGKPPILAARIQELFGWLETPVIAGGRVPVMMHLLAPNMRPQQVTQDLRSFWSRTYPEVRKELRQRYPKHAWPEDPFQAKPERRPQRRRK